MEHTIKTEEMQATEPPSLSEIKDEKPDTGTKTELIDLFSTSSPKRSPPPPPPPIRTPSPEPKPKPRGRRKGLKSSNTPPAPPTLIDDLPTAWDEAHETFVSLEKCVYERKDMGTSRELDEMMVCDCVYDKRDPLAEPCGRDSDCINRAIFIECLADECRARSQCRNQRFMKKQYAPIEIVLTPKKGYGLRAAENIPSGSLIYEYIGEVIQEKTFRKRMQQYAEEGIRHFYFMMLQKEEYIDATKKGGIGRFANHSCNPNSEVQKWVVGRRLRMGIFTKRDVIKGEEITFNYNVDRYGHDAQICYCGEENCVGTIGGKTQTDVGTMDDLFLDALGIMDEVEELGLKGNKKKKAKQLDEDFIPVLGPIQGPEVQKVAAAMRQSMENPKMMSRLLQRINMTDEAAIHRQLMRMHGFGIMNMVITQQASDRDNVFMALESMSKWKLQIRNKVEDSGIEEGIKALTLDSDESISGLAKDLLEYWSTLTIEARIPRKSKITTLDAEDEAATFTIAEADSMPRAEHRRPQAWENTNSIQFEIAPIVPRLSHSFPRPRPLPAPPARTQSQQNTYVAERSKLDAIIALAQQNVASAAAAAVVPVIAEATTPESPAESSRSAEEREEAARRKKQKRAHRVAEIGDVDEAKKEKALTKLVGDVVVKAMSKYKEQMEHDTFKRYAKECTGILVDKEKKGHTYASTRIPALSDEKKAKMKSFVKDYTHKLLKRLKDKGKLRRPTTNSHASSSTPSATPARTGISDTPSGILETPNGSSGDGAELDLVADIFGEESDDDGDEERMELDGDDTEKGKREGKGKGKVEAIDLTISSPVRGEALLIPRKEVEKGLSKVNGYGSVNGNGNGNGSANGVGKDRKGSFGAVFRVDSFRPGVGNGVGGGGGGGGMNKVVLPENTPDRTPSSRSGGDPSPGSGRRD